MVMQVDPNDNDKIAVQIYGMRIISKMALEILVKFLFWYIIYLDQWYPKRSQSRDLVDHSGSE